MHTLTCPFTRVLIHSFVSLIFLLLSSIRDESTENLRPSGPPMMTDWWVKESNSADMSDFLPNHSNDSAGVAHLSSQMCCGYDLGGAPSASLDSSERGKKTMPSDAASVTASSSESDDRKSPKIFQNRGFQLWSESRREWRTYADSSSDAKAGRAIQNGNNAMTFAAESEEGESGPSDVNRSPALQGLSTREVEGLLRGMTRVTRTYELPRRIKLPDMVDLLVDVWECED